MVLRGGQVVGCTDPAQADERMLAADDGGPGGDAGGGQECRPIRATWCWTSQDLSVLDDTAEQVAVKESSSRCARGRCWASPASRATARPSWWRRWPGCARSSSGTIRILGHDTTHATPRQMIELGVAHVPEDRQRDGLVLTFPVADNLVLNTYYHAAVRPGPGAAARRHRQAARNAGRGVRRAHPERGYTRLQPLGRQPAEGDRGARVCRAQSSC